MQCYRHTHTLCHIVDSFTFSVYYLYLIYILSVCIVCINDISLKSHQQLLHQHTVNNFDSYNDYKCSGHEGVMKPYVNNLCKYTVAR